MTSTADTLETWLQGVRDRTDRRLAEWSVEARRRWPGETGEAIAYALGGEGKRLRPALLFAGYEAAGGTGDPVDLAAAVETVHTYSLVHDDLPCMDDDDLRRGRPTVHRVFSVPAAVEAGFRMVALAAWGIGRGAAALGLTAAARRELAEALFQGAGVDGMIGGQVLDLEAESRALTIGELTTVHRAKTGRLLTASVVMGGIAAGAGDPERRALAAFGDAVGLAFQVVDDVLDATGTSQQLGKTAGKDLRQGKSTFPGLLGLDGARQEAERLVRSAMDRLGAGTLDSTRLAGIARRILERQS